MPHVHTTAMITVQTQNINTLTQEKYDAIVAGLQLHQITCSCGHCGDMRKFGHYERTVWFRGTEIVLSVQRLQCTHCGRTHAILLDIIVPYSRIPVEDQQQIIILCEAGVSCKPVQQSNPLIEDRMVYVIWNKYCRHWKQTLLAEGISLVGELIKECFRCYCRQFMQIRSTPNRLFSPST